MDIGSYLKITRKIAGLTQNDVAEKMSLSRQTVWNIENSRRKVGVDYITRFASIVDKTPAVLLEGYEKVRKVI